MKIVYVAGPFSGKDSWEVENNIRRAEELGYQVALAGAMPLIPHTNTRFFNGTKDYQFWIEGTLELLRRSDAVIFTLDWERSSGARGEHREALRLGLPIFYTVGKLQYWLEQVA